MRPWKNLSDLDKTQEEGARPENGPHAAGALVNESRTQLPQFVHFDSHRQQHFKPRCSIQPPPLNRDLLPHIRLCCEAHSGFFFSCPKSLTPSTVIPLSALLRCPGPSFVYLRFCADLTPRLTPRYIRRVFLLFDLSLSPVLFNPSKWRRLIPQSALRTCANSCKRTKLTSTLFLQKTATSQSTLRHVMQEGNISAVLLVLQALLS